MAVLKQEGDLIQQAKLYNNLGIAAYFAGDWPGALANYERRRDLARRAGDLVLEATVLSNIGEILSDRGDVDTAIGLFEWSLEAFTSAQHAIGVALANGNFGRAALRKGDVGRARRLLEHACAGFEAINASSFVAEGRLIEAAAAGEAVRLARETGATFEEARSLQVRAAVGRALADLASRDADEAAKLLAHLGARRNDSELPQSR
jgi:tetratricopeptide (TPR) repeat protein